MRRYKNKSRLKNSSGFTLVELLITIIVLGIVVTSLSGMYYTMQLTETKSQHYDLAVRAARTEIEDLRNSGYDALTPGNNIDFSSSLPRVLPKGATGTVQISEPMPSLRRVDVTVSYSEFGQTQNVELSSDIGIIGLGQEQ